MVTIRQMHQVELLKFHPKNALKLLTSVHTIVLNKSLYSKLTRKTKFCQTLMKFHELILVDLRMDPFQQIHYIIVFSSILG